MYSHLPHDLCTRRKQTKTQATMEVKSNPSMSPNPTLGSVMFKHNLKWTMEDFKTGVYLIWPLSASITVTLAHNTTISCNLFFPPRTSPQQTWSVHNHNMQQGSPPLFIRKKQSGSKFSYIKREVWHLLKIARAIESFYKLVSYLCDAWIML